MKKKKGGCKVASFSVVLVLAMVEVYKELRSCRFCVVSGWELVTSAVGPQPLLSENSCPRSEGMKVG